MNKQIPTVWLLVGILVLIGSLAPTGIQVWHDLLHPDWLGRTARTIILYWESERLMRTGRWEDSMKLLERVVKLDPRDTKAWLELGQGYAQVHFITAGIPFDIEKERRPWVEKGIRTLKRGIRLNPDSAKLKYELGSVYFLQVGDIENAIHYFRLAIEAAQKQADGPPGYYYHFLAHSYERLPDIGKALALWEADKKEHPKCSTAAGAVWTLRRRWLKPWLLMEEMRYGDALVLLGKLPDRPFKLRMKAELYKRMGATDRRIAVLKALSLGERGSSARFELEKLKKEEGIKP